MARKKRTSKEENQLAKTKSAKIKSAKTRKFSREQVKKREDILAAGTEESALETLASQVRALSARHQAILRKRRDHCVLGNTDIGLLLGANRTVSTAHLFSELSV